MITNCHCTDVKDLIEKLKIASVRVIEARFIIDLKFVELKDTQSMVGIVFENELQERSAKQIKWFPQCDTCLPKLKDWLESQKKTNE